jgi:hypothetical protein
MFVLPELAIVVRQTEKVKFLNKFFYSPNLQNLSSFCYLFTAFFISKISLKIKNTVMKPKNLLQNFEYKSYDSFGIGKNGISKSHTGNQSPSVELKIDFVSGNLVMQADWKFIIQYHRSKEQQTLLANKNRVQIQMDFSPRGVIDLNEFSNNSLLFPLEGDILHEFTSNTCIGMLVLENKSQNMQDNNLWRLTFYIYQSIDDGEIKFDLPLSLIREFKMN